MKNPERGDIYIVDLFPRSGSEQSGERPFLILSRNSFTSEHSWQTITGIPISSSQVEKKKGRISILLLKGEGGLTKDSVGLCHQITTIDKGKLITHLGAISGDRLKVIEEGVKLYLEIE